MLGQPHAVVGTVEFVAFRVHPPALYFDHVRLAVTRADPRGRSPVRREVDVLASSFQQPVRSDRGEQVRGRPVVEQGRRSERRVTEFDADGMTLTRPDPRAVRAQGETLLVVFPHHRLQLFAGDGEVVRRARREQVADADPARAVQLDPDQFGLVSEHAA